MLDEASFILTSGSVVVLALLLFGFFGPETLVRKFSIWVFAVTLMGLLWLL